MKRRTAFIATIMAALMLPLSSCNLTDGQAKVVAQNAGLAAAVTWIAYDDPSAEQIAVVKTVLGVIKGVTADTSEGATYTQVLFPIVEDKVDAFVVDGTIKANERPLILAGSLAMLNGLDLLFATNPEWNDNHKLARQVVDHFILGAEGGLSLADDDPRMVNARSSNAARARAFSK
jgi:hypothetical protein